MRKFKLTISNGLVSKYETIVEVEDQFADDELELENIMREEAMNVIDWHYEEIK